MSEDNHEVIFLRGKRVHLRPVERVDLPLLRKWMNDRRVTQYLHAYLPATEVGEEKWFEKLHKNMERHVVLIMVADDKAIGIMGLHEIDHLSGTATTGTVIGEREYRSKGYGTEAKMLLLAYAFYTLNLRKVCSTVLAFNKRSYRYGLRCGYHQEGVRKNQHFHDGRYVDELLLAVFRDKHWKRLWEEFRTEHDIEA